MSDAARAPSAESSWGRGWTRRTLNAEERRAVRALCGFAIALVAVPAVTYRVASGWACPAAYERYGAALLATESGRATCAGMFAILSVNAVLLAYVVWVTRSSGSAPREVEKKNA
ncbi:unnamed product [Ostreococcus tauri]|uniref:Unnamed product n=1 Tax=Ostreococcus tauri TaxID=70448 RepID=A0A090M942_OSTTA|nr:unnamed product [Ostreococcus tauri]CEF98659.1 unnamed product [Ostreococcus tauri]|eukprot:XP_003080258.2 unnamed product [Ostreococcus tauri]